LKGYTHFLTPKGKGSVLSEGPWYYGVDYLTVYFVGNRKQLARLLPHPLKIGDGMGLTYVAEFVSVSATDFGNACLNPAQTIYNEAAVGISCTYKERKGVYFPFMWVDTDWSMIRGWLLGYPKKIADDIQMTRTHPLNRLAASFRKGIGVMGYCTRQGRSLVEIGLTIERRGDRKDVIDLGAAYGLRHFPGVGKKGTPVNEVVEIVKSGFRVGKEVWVGDATLKFGDSLNEELEFARPVRLLYGCRYSTGFANLAVRVLPP
jgi:hypothetical protein